MQIQFEKLTEKDIELVRQWRNSEFVSKYMYTDTQITVSQQLQWFKRVENDTTCRYWIIKREDEQLGLASITNIDERNGKCFWAFYLSSEALAGSGIGAIVEFFVIKYAFEELSLNKISCEVFAFNEKVVGLHEKFGFVKEGMFRQHIFKNGKYEDIVAMGLLKEDWKKIEERFAKLFKNKIYGY